MDENYLEQRWLLAPVLVLVLVLGTGTGTVLCADGCRDRGWEDGLGWAGLDLEMEKLAEALALGMGLALTRYLRRAVPTPRRPLGACSRYL